MTTTAVRTEGVPLTDSTLADWVGAVTVSLAPLVERIEGHVRAAPRIHVDDTPVPVLAPGKTRTGHLWAVVRDDRPFAGTAAPAAAYFYSATRSGEHVESWLAGYAGPMQSDAFAGYNRLYDPNRKPGPILEVGCWAHARRKFFDLADLRRAPMAAATVKAIDAVFEIEREINGRPPDERLAVRRERSRPLVAALETRLRADRAQLSPKNDTARAIDYMLKRWPAFTRFLDDGRLCLSNNAAERAVRGIAIGRKNWTFAGSDAGGRRAAAMYTLIETAKLNDIDPRAWLADVLARLRSLPDGDAKADETEALIARVRTFAGFREYPKFGYIRRFGIYKRALAAEADRLVAAGVLRARDDAWFLRFEELQEVVRTGAADHDLIAQRRQALEVSRSVTPPRVLTSEGEAVAAAYDRGDLPDGALPGLAVSTGVVEGRARVILDLAEADIEPGDILVTVGTDPSWSPLFVSIAALVTEVGGLMTHGAVIAREYGLPAVVGVERATELIAEGQRIRVHGTDGFVELVD